MLAAVRAASKDIERMSFDGKVGLVLNGGQLLAGKTDVHFDYAVTICAG